VNRPFFYICASESEFDSIADVAGALTALTADTEDGADDGTEKEDKAWAG
jgi:hypothetical protein